jgi:mono/diheme cytochrome c family protein
MLAMLRLFSRPTYVFALAIVAIAPSADRVLAQRETVAAPAFSVIAGFERFHAKGEDPVRGGQLLLGELNCVSCHAIDPARETLILRKSAPVLDGVASRIRPGYVRRFISDPQGTKPGTAMPDVFAALPAAEKAASVEAILHFLASTGTLKQEKPQRKQVASGRDLFHKVGCVACHGTRDAAGKEEKLFATSVPLGDLTAKYTIASLRSFLENPHATRPSGRMPSLLNSEEASAVANYLLQGASYNVASVANLNYSYYEGSWQTLPDFAGLKPIATGTAVGFDLSLARRNDDMAMKFDGFLKIERDGDYRFYLTSDDGSKLWIDGKLVVANDGIHPPTTMSGAATLSNGIHAFTAAVFNAGGGVELDVDMKGPGLGRQKANAFVFRTPEGNPGPKPSPVAKDDGPIAVQPDLAAKGRALFVSQGCAHCHQESLVKNTEPVKAAPLEKLSAAGGCMSATGATAKRGIPHYALSAVQRSALAAALKNVPALAAKQDAGAVVQRTMVTFNCYACHERNKVGGVTEPLNPYFATAQPEMGDEGRLPPLLTGAGAKLNAEYLRQILDKGAHDRPYMHTRMPGFGNANVGVLVAMLENADRAERAPTVTLALPPAKIKGEARALVGAGALACIKCHTFAQYKAEGVQGIDLTLMTKRLRKSWFHHYMIDPNKYRPGTRMPSGFPGGQTFYPKVLGGTAEQQIEGIWTFLADGAKAALPPGTGKQQIQLVPTGEAIVYRNFIEGAGPRAIGVGYPEQAHLAFDANDLRLAMIWQGAFIDASRHWTGRGDGFEPPAGDNVLHLAKGVAFAVLDKADEAWPTQSAREMPGYQFNGYRVTRDERPTFLYTIHGVKIEDFPSAITGNAAPGIRRTLTLKAANAPANLFFRAATGAKIAALGDGWYQVNEYKLRIESDAAPQIRQVGGQFELRVPVRFKDGAARILEEYQW